MNTVADSMTTESAADGSAWGWRAEELKAIDCGVNSVNSHIRRHLWFVSRRFSSSEPTAGGDVMTFLDVLVSRDGLYE